MASLAWSVLMLLLVLAAVPACLWAMKRLQTLKLNLPGAQAPRAMQVVSQLSLGPRERLVTVRVGHRTLVLGVTAQQVALVTELAEGELALVERRA